MRKQRTGTKIGYARVSTKDQSTEQQVAALIAHGVDKDNIFIETVSGVSKRRPRLEEGLLCRWLGGLCRRLCCAVKWMTWNQSDAVRFKIIFAAIAVVLY